MQRFSVVIILLAVLIASFIYYFAGRVTEPPPNYTQIEPSFYVGGTVITPPPGTTCILSLSLKQDEYTAQTHEWQPIPDAAPAPSLEWLQKQVAFITTQRALGKCIYVHCDAGISRSGMVATAYIMSRDLLTRDQALVYLRQRRPDINPNGAFMNLLSEYQNALAQSLRSQTVPQQ